MHFSSWRAPLLAAALLSFGACKSEKAPTTGTSAEALTAKAAPAPSPAPPVAAPAGTAAAPAVAEGQLVAEAEGIKVSLLPEGRVAIAGKDQWGAPLDTTYESPQFFKNAVPVLERAVTPAQAAALKQAADKLAAK